MMEIINKENNWDHMTEASMVEGLVEKVTHKEMVTAVKPMKPRKAIEPSKVCTQMASANK